MATQNKPAAKTAAKKKPARRGPTKAAALKALGLTQEDLDALKALREPPNAEPEPILTEPKYEDAQDELERRPAPQPQAVQLPEEPKVPVFYVRNLHHTEVSFRLDRQQKQGERRTALKPRGQRNDMVRLQPGDLNDTGLQTQVAYGLVEVIPEAEAMEVIKKQAYNASPQAHTPTAVLRSEYGNAYEPHQIKTDAEFNSQGVKVADLDPVAGEYGEIVVDRGGIRRERPQQGHTSGGIGGNPAIVSDGFAQSQDASQLGAVDQSSVAKDALARSKQFEGPGAGLGTVAVVVEPTRRS